MAVDPLDPDTCRIRVGYGIASGARHDAPKNLESRADRLRINNVTLTGATTTYAPPTC